LTGKTSSAPGRVSSKEGVVFNGLFIVFKNYSKDYAILKVLIAIVCLTSNLAQSIT
jgi:hypothetical protein